MVKSIAHKLRFASNGAPLGACGNSVPQDCTLQEAKLGEIHFDSLCRY